MSESEDIVRRLAAAACEPPAPPPVPWWKKRAVRVALGMAIGSGVPVLCLEFGGEGWPRVLCTVAKALLPFLPSIGGG